MKNGTFQHRFRKNVIFDQELYPKSYLLWLYGDLTNNFEL